MNRPHRGGTTTTRAPAAALAPPAGHTVHAVTGRRAGWRRAALPLGAALALLAVWEAGVRAFDVPAFVLPAPSQVAEAAVRTAPLLPAHVSTTLTEAGLGLALGTTVGTLLTFAVVLLPRLGAARFTKCLHAAGLCVPPWRARTPPICGRCA